MDNAGPIINPSSFSRRELGKTMFKLPNCKRNDNLRFSVSLVLELNKILVKRRERKEIVSLHAMEFCMMFVFIHFY